MKKVTQSNVATATTTESAPKVIVQASAKVVAAITAQINAFTLAGGAMLETARVVESEAKRMGLDRKAAGNMVTSSWCKARGLDIADATARRKVGPDVSKVLLLAFPPDEGAITARDTILAFNSKNGAVNKRVGINTLLDVVRGRLTPEEAIEGKSASRNPNGPAVQPKIGTASFVIGLDPMPEQAANAIAAFRKAYQSDSGLTLADLRKIAADGLK